MRRLRLKVLAPAKPPAWSGWRGGYRDAIVSWLPDRLPDEPTIVWRMPLRGPGLGGIAATSDWVIFGDRDVADVQDEFHCLDSETGALHWTFAYPAPGKLDYGNSPRATPLICDGQVFLHSAFGHFHCVRIDDGSIVWAKDLNLDFGPTKDRPWGTCDSPLLIRGKLIVRPGSADAAIAALDPVDGTLLWKMKGAAPAYGSLLAGKFGGVLQVVGHDEVSLGGWEISTGKRIWTLEPEVVDDFNVPMPVAMENQLVVSSENNGTRLYEFSDGGKINPVPIATNKDVHRHCDPRRD